MNGDLNGGCRQALRCLFIAAVMAAVSWPTPAHSGNLEMAEQRTDELDEVNRQAVSRIPEALPADGVIELEADVVGQGSEAGIDIKAYEIRRGQIPRSDPTRVGDKADADEAKGRISRSRPTRP